MHTYIGGVHILEAYFVRFKIKLLFCCFAKAMLLWCNVNAFALQLILENKEKSKFVQTD